MSEFCGELPIPADIICVESGTTLITRFIYGHLGHELVMPTLSAGQTEQQAISALIATRLALPGNDPLKLYSFDIFKGTIPKPSPSYKTDPHRGINIVSEVDTKMKIEWTDYINNKERYDFMKKLSEGTGLVKAWALSGKQLIGGLKGLDGSFTSIYSMLDGAEMPSSMTCEFNWMGSPMPERFKIA